jgi:mannose-1-phosphate guanylyltransferase/mannose-6-phosphate isomerase
MKIQPIILCGGSGTRLWPMSRTTYPKQLLSPLGGLSLLQQTVMRFMKDDYESPMVICNEGYRFLVAEQLKEIHANNVKIILEPCSRNTAPAIALGAIFADPDQHLLFCPSDHNIQRFDLFEECLKKAMTTANDNKIITFGIRPTSPKTGYGYIVPSGLDDVFEVKKFVEKPTVDVAEDLLKQNAFWNSGLFYAKASVFLDDIKEFLPQTYDHSVLCKQNATKDLDFIRIPEEFFSKCDPISIDYGVIEKSSRIRGVACNGIEWSDIGNWETVWGLSEKNEEGNAFVGDVVAQGVSNSYVRSEGVLISVIGLENIVIVATPDAVLVADKSKAENVKDMTTHLKGHARSEIENHKKVYRPWGYYQEIEKGDRFKVKRLMVKPQEQTSVQIHHHRSEHWVVVSGTALVLVGEDKKLIHENESIYIPFGTPHSIENPGKIDLHFIEVQSGSYLGEDDIVRLKDIYGRV